MRNILQGGLASNYSEVSAEELIKEYEMYLMDGKTIRQYILNINEIQRISSLMRA